jgi:glycerol-3-phosphate dehydrogenase
MRYAVSLAAPPVLQVAESINNSHENPKYFRGFTLPESCRASTNLEEVLERSEIIILAIPTPYIEATLGGQYALGGSLVCQFCKVYKRGAVCFMFDTLSLPPAWLC